MKNENELTPEDIERLKKELARQDASQRQAALKTKSSFMKFLERLGLRILAEKIIHYLDDIWDILVTLF